MSSFHRHAALCTTLAAIALSAADASAQTTRGTQAQLQAQTKISMAAAKASALSKVPGGWVKASELEREHGKLLYSFDIATKGKTGIDEVQIDAITGKQIGGVVHETPKDEMKEAKVEAKEKKATMKKP